MANSFNSSFPFKEEDSWKKKRVERDRLLLLQRINYERNRIIGDTYERIRSGKDLNLQSK